MSRTKITRGICAFCTAPIKRVQTSQGIFWRYVDAKPGQDAYICIMSTRRGEHYPKLKARGKPISEVNKVQGRMKGGDRMRARR